MRIPVTSMNDEHTDGPLRVLVLAEDFYPRKAGGAYIDWNVANHLAESGDTVTVVTPKNETTERREVVNDVEIRRPFLGTPEDTPPNSIYGQLRRILFALIVVPYLGRLLWQRDFDVIYSTNHLFHPIASLLRIAFSVPLVTFVGYSPSIHDEVSLTDPLVLLERMNFRFFMGDRALCRTPSVKKELDRLSNAHSSVMNGIVDRSDLEAAMDVNENNMVENNVSGPTKQLVFVGRFSAIKRPKAMVHLLSNLPDRYSLVLVGDGPRRSIVEEEIRRQSLDDRVRVTGRLPHPQALRVIYEADLLVLPSTTEAYPTVVFEALSLKTPVLATPVGVLPTIDHSLLTTAELSAFQEVLPTIDLETDDGIDEETLDRFSVDRFTQDTHSHFISTVERQNRSNK